MEEIFFAFQSGSFKLNSYMTMFFLVFKLTREFFEHKRFTCEKIMKWTPSNPDLNSSQKSMVTCEDDIIKRYQMI